MPRFQYKAYAKSGAFEEGKVTAENCEAAIAALFERGLHPFETTASTPRSEIPWWERDLFGPDRLSQNDLAIFSREMATLLSADLPLDEILRIVEENTTQSRTRRMAGQILADILDGVSLSTALQNRGGAFPPYFVSIVHAGEASGSLARVFSELADFVERSVEIRSRIQSALIYPSVLFVMAVLAIVVIVTTLIPNIAPLFADSNADMPVFVWFCLEAEAVISRWWPFIIGTLFVSVLSIVLVTRRQGARQILDRWMLCLPLIGGLLKKSETARFSRTMATLLRSGVPLLSALEVARPVIRNRVFVQIVHDAIGKLKEGSKLRDALASGGVLPTFALRLISLGEQTGRLEDMFFHIAKVFEAQVSRRIDRLMTLLTPMITLIIGLGVGGLIMSVMGAILSVNELALQ